MTSFEIRGLHQTTLYVEGVQEVFDTTPQGVAVAKDWRLEQGGGEPQLGHTYSNKGIALIKGTHYRQVEGNNYVKVIEHPDYVWCGGYAHGGGRSLKYRDRNVWESMLGLGDGSGDGSGTASASSLDSNQYGTSESCGDADGEGGLDPEKGICWGFRD